MEALQHQLMQHAGPVYSMQRLSNQQIANTFAAMLLQKHTAHTDPLLAASRSGSPYLGPHTQQDANNATGALEANAMQLPASAKPLPASPFPVPAPQQQQQQHCAAGAHQHSCADSHCSHNSAHTEEPAMGTPQHISLFMPAPRPATPTPMAQQQSTTQQQQQPAAATPAAAAAAVPSAPAAASSGGNGPAAAAAAPAPAPLPVPFVPPATANSAKSWLYQLVTCPYLFKPCPQCSATHSGREVLITYFDPDSPAHGYCTYCPQRASRPRLLQIRRSTYHEVVKAADVSRIADVSGIQHYVINGAKVLFLRPRPQPRPPKGVVAPARCAVDGRQLMDAHSSYCSLRCKLEVEDTMFAAHYPSAIEEMEAAAAAAEAGDGGDGGQLAGAAAHLALAGTYHRQGGHEGRRVVVPSGKRSAPAAAAAASGDHPGHDDGSSEEGDAEHRQRAKRQRNLPSKFANTVLGSNPNYQAACAGGLTGGKAGSHPHHHHGHHQQHHSHHQGGKAAAAAFVASGGDDTASDQVAGMLQQPQQVGSPCASEDSNRSSTCNQRWHHKRKVMQPCRAPLQ